MIKLYFDQLSEYHSHDETSKAATWDWLMVANIWFLEKYGYLKSDEFNGCVMSYADKLPPGWA